MTVETLPETGTSSTQTQAPISEAPKMLDKAILLQIDTKRFGNSRKVDVEQIQADADKDLLRVSKTLLECAELKAVSKLDDEMRAYVSNKCLPSVLRKGVFLLPIASVEKVNAKLHQFKVQRTALVDQFVAAYEDAINQAAERLRGLFNVDDYPPTVRIKETFALQWNYVAFGVPDTLAHIDEALFEQEREKVNAQWSEAQTVVQDLLRVRMLKMVEHLTDRLTPGADGKMKTFKSSTLSNIDEFLQDFETLNITGDAQLSEVVSKAKELLNGVDAETLRKTDGLRDALASQFSELETQLTGLIVDKPKRAIRFEDE